MLFMIPAPPKGYSVVADFKGIPVAVHPCGLPLYYREETQEWAEVFSGRLTSEAQEEKLAILGPPQ
jgi:hypothetical protein